MDIKGAFTKKYGPLTAWQWGGATLVLVYFFLRNQKKNATPPAGSTSGGPGGQGTPGEFQSQQSQTKIDPETGEQITSSYNATGPLAGGWGGGVGLPMAYPMPYQGGDVYVNLPGDTQTLNPGVNRPGRYPPATGPGPVTGSLVGGYWWTPRTSADIGQLVSKSGLNADPNWQSKLSGTDKVLLDTAVSYMRIMEANPQVDWSQDFTKLVGTPIYIPQAWGNWQKTGQLPTGGSITGPTGYTPPTQTTGVSGTS